MERRSFLQLSAVALSSRLKALADTPMPIARLGKSGLRVSRFTLGGSDRNSLRKPSTQPRATSVTITILGEMCRSGLKPAVELFISTFHLVQDLAWL